MKIIINGVESEVESIILIPQDGITMEIDNTSIVIKTNEDENPDGNLINIHDLAY
jgi:hypothetical protein